MDTVHAYRNRHTAYRPEHVWDGLTDEEYLERIGAAKRAKTDQKIHPTAAGLLMFGEEFRILYEYPEYFLDYREMLDPSIRWTDRLQSSSGDWTGNLFDFFFRVYPKLVKDLKIPFKLEGITRIDDTPVHKALREALANCLVNTDFFLARGVVIKKVADEIIMENPGSIRTGKDQMLKGGISDPRNKTLMKMFNMIGIGERAGSGVPDIYAVWDSQGWKEPMVEEQYNPDRTILKLSLVKRQAEKTSEKKVAKKSGEKKAAKKSGEKKVTKKTQENYNVILDAMQPDVWYKAADFMDYIQVKESRVKELLADLVELGKVESIGSTKGKKYKKGGK